MNNGKYGLVVSSENYGFAIINDMATKNKRQEQCLMEENDPQELEKEEFIEISGKETNSEIRKMIHSRFLSCFDAVEPTNKRK